MKKRLLSLVMVLCMVLSIMPMTALADSTYYINGKSVRADDFSSSPNECWSYAQSVYQKIWGVSFSNEFGSSDNSLRNLSDSELTLTVNHLRSYVSNAALGSVLRICNSEYLHGSDGWGHSQIIVQKDSSGFTVFQGGLSASPYRNERYYTWSEYVNNWNYDYIKYIKWPGANSVSPTPSLSVSKYVNCARQIQLPERVVNVYAGVLDTSRLTYYSYGPLVQSYQYAVMSDGSIRYKIGINHGGQDMDAWIVYESDMSVTKQHTYGNTQYEAAHPHKAYRVCECGDTYYTGATRTVDGCDQCVTYVEISFDANGGSCDTSFRIVVKGGSLENIPSATRTGYTFDGWYTAASGGTKITTSTVFNNDQTVYAHWTAGCTHSYLYYIDKVNATCTEDGTEAYWKCSTCGKMFSDTVERREITSPVVIPATGHNYSALESAVDFNGDGAINFTTVNGVRDLFPKTDATHSETVDGNRIFNYDGSVMGTFAVGVDGVGSGYTGDRVCKGCGTVKYGSFMESLTSTHKPERTSTGFLPYADSDGQHVDGRTDTYYCSKCDKHFGGARIDYDEYYGLAKEGDTKVIGAFKATCNDEGYTGDSYEFSGNKWVLVQYGEVISAQGHDFVDIPDKAPSCTESGYHFENGIMCIRCGIWQYDNYTIMPPAGHQWTNEVREEPTCQKTGVSVEVCTVCGEEGETTSTAKLEHVASDALANIKSATCTEAGYTGDTVCKWCGEVLKAGSVIAAAGHNWSEWTVTKAATETVPGEKTRSCTVCGETQKETIPVLSHTHTLAIVAKVDPTCTENGSEAYWKCSGCGKMFSDAQGKNEIDEPVVIEALGHDYNAVVTAPTCTEKGFTTHTCSRCDASYVDSYKNVLGHSYTTVNKTHATCTEDGYTGDKVCQRCGDVLENGSVIPAAGHDWSEWVVIQEATAGAPAVETRVCSTCGETETREVSSVTPLVITTQPETYSGAVNTYAPFIVVAQGDGLTYQWQLSDDGGKTWVNSSVKAATYITKLTAARDGRMVRCIVTDQYGNTTMSNTVAMKVYRFAITSQPVDYVGAANSTASFSVTAEGNGLNYQWQYSDNGGKTWTNSSVKKSVYSTKLSRASNGRLVRCIVTDQNGNSATSNSASMSIYELEITTQPKNYTGAVNSTAKFTVVAEGEGLTYQWQVSDNNGKTWTNSSVKKAVYTSKLTAARNGRMVRCIVTDASGNSVTSNSASMKISGPTITIQPKDYVGKVNSTAKFTVVASGDGLNYQWQISDNGGKNWTSSSVKAASYSTKLTTAKNGRMVRCIVSDASGAQITSNAVSMKIG